MDIITYVYALPFGEPSLGFRSAWLWLYWPWIPLMTLTMDFQGKLWNGFISWIVVPIDKKRKSYKSIRCWINCMTLTFDPTHDLDLGYQAQIWNSHIFTDKYTNRISEFERDRKRGRMDNTDRTQTNLKSLVKFNSDWINLAPDDVDAFCPAYNTISLIGDTHWDFRPCLSENSITAK